MASSTVENYVKAIYLEGRVLPDGLVPMGRLAGAMRVVPGTATSMVKTLADSGLVAYEPREGVRLTSGGRRLALHVLRRHRLVELFLVRTLGLDWSEVHAEAEELEHAISDKVLDRIDEMLGHPAVDPHGDPIPTAGGTVAEPSRGQQSLADAEPGATVRVARVTDQDPAFLQFIDRCGLAPGATATIVTREPAADAITVRPAATRSPVSLGAGPAGKVIVEPLAGTPAVEPPPSLARPAPPDVDDEHPGLAVD